MNSLNTSLFLCLIAFSFASFLHAQEIDCGNGIDDDGDMLIDCNDPDCMLQGLPNLPSTGTNAAQTGILPFGSQDLHWQVSLTGPTGSYAPAIVIPPYPVFVTSPWAEAEWIAHNVDGNHVPRDSVIDYYELRFFLPCSDVNGNDVSSGAICLFMEAYADNSIHEVYVNGSPQSAGIPSIPHASNPYYACGFCPDSSYMITLCDNWVSGENILRIGVASAPSAVALLVRLEFISSPLTMTQQIIHTAQVDSTSQQTILIYPNPSSGNLYLEGDMDGSSYELRTLQGSMLHQADVEKEKLIDLSYLPSGVYYIRVIAPNGKSEINKILLHKD